MELIYKVAVAAVVTAVLGILLRKQTPELSALMSFCAAVIILLACLPFLNDLGELTEYTQKALGIQGTYLTPVLKCTAISMITKFASAFCRDQAHSAVASALEMSGTICAICVSLPLIVSVLKMIGGML